MAKRDFPLFIFDTDRRHGHGECDFVTCTDIDNGFIARIAFMEDCAAEFSDMVMTGEERNGIRLRFEVQRIFGKNPEPSARRTLLRKAVTLFTERQTVAVNVDNPTTADCVAFLDKLIEGNIHHIDECGSDFNQRKIVMTSITMLRHIKRRLENEE